MPTIETALWLLLAQVKLWCLPSPPGIDRLIYWRLTPAIKQIPGQPLSLSPPPSSGTFGLSSLLSSNEVPSVWLSVCLSRTCIDMLFVGLNLDEIGGRFIISATSRLLVLLGPPLSVAITATSLIVFFPPQGLSLAFVSLLEVVAIHRHHNNHHYIISLLAC